MRIVNKKDFLSGILFGTLGAGFAILAPGYSLGTPARMGAGSFPLVLGLCLVAVGVGVIARSLVVPGEPLAPIKLRPALSLLAAIILFGILLQPLGLALSLIVLVMVGGYASPDFRLREGLVLAVCLSVGCSLLFVTGLGLPLPVWPSF